MIATTEGEKAGSIGLANRAFLFHAESPDQAHERGMAQWLAVCPRTEGWTSHDVYVQPLDEGQLVSVFKAQFGVKAIAEVMNKLGFPASENAAAGILNMLADRGKS